VRVWSIIPIEGRRPRLVLPLGECPLPPSVGRAGQDRMSPAISGAPDRRRATVRQLRFGARGANGSRVSRRERESRWACPISRARSGRLTREPLAPRIGGRMVQRQAVSFLKRVQAQNTHETRAMSLGSETHKAARWESLRQVHRRRPRLVLAVSQRPSSPSVWRARGGSLKPNALVRAHHTAAKVVS
jgi:hypothetical protein